jgi:long-subunit fatty acid transport protein
MLFFSLFIFVSGYYYQQNDVGGYSLGVGGAPIGLNNNVECGLYNPAAFASNEKMKIFTGCKLRKGEMVSVAWPEDTFLMDYNFPDYLGVSFPFGKDFFCGLSLSVPYMYASQGLFEGTVVDSSVPEGYREVLFDIEDAIRFYTLNPAIGKTINDKFSVGLNIALFWMRLSSSFESGDYEYGSSSYTLDKYGIEPCLGLQYKANDIFSFGFLIKKGFGEAYKENYDGSVSSIESGESLPLVVGLGTGTNLKDRVYINLSAEYLQWTLAYSEGYMESDDYRNIIRLHLGGLYRFNDVLSISAGFYTEPAPINSISTFGPDSWDQMFLSGGIGLDFGRIALNLGAASSALIKKDPSFREENHLNISLVYR